MAAMKVNEPVPSTGQKVIRVGTRESALAMAQTEEVVNKLKQTHKHINFKIVSMKTIGDKIQDKALSKIGEKSLFTKELEIGLENNDIDLVVHSLKDLPSTLPENMVIGAIMERVDPRDTVIMKKGSENKSMSLKSLNDLSKGSVLGTSAVRRGAQLRAAYPDLEFQDIRGNLNTRFRKLDAEDGPYSAIILAAAGVKRLGWEDRISSYLPQDVCLHAVGQGALGIECRKKDWSTLDIVHGLNHIPTLLSCVAERAVMRKLEGGCSVPVAAHAEVVEEKTEDLTKEKHEESVNCYLKITAGVWSIDGKKALKKSKQIKLEHPSLKVHNNEAFFENNFAKEETNKLFSSVCAPVYYHQVLEQVQNLGIELAQNLLDDGAGPILQEAKLCNNTK